MTTELKQLHDHSPVAHMYKEWFLSYASYVILDRAVPALEDGLKPVQRRILHALQDMDDGRYHKVANVIGQTMQYHPHGDASIYEALVNLGQKDLLIDMQGNWGDYRTGDQAAAPRYIEARLSKFANEVCFNADITQWQLSYDGRKREPVELPIKFPLLLAQGVEGIAVGLSTRILPHNFGELIQASIDILRGKTTQIQPDFATGGMADCSQYNSGKKGSRVRVRAKIETQNKTNLLVKQIPFGTTTSSLIDSIVKANDKGKIKIKKVTDNTAQDVEIAIELPAGVSPDLTIDALYAFTDCEVSLAANCCVIVDNKPQFMGVDELLRVSTHNTLHLLRLELQNKLAHLLEKLHFASLEQIFIEKRIYRKIEECETFDAVIATIDKGLKPYTKQFVRAVTHDDILRLTEIRIKRISKYDSFKAQDLIKQLDADISQTQHHLVHLVDFAVAYFEDLLKKYGKNRPRQTELRNFDTIVVQQVAVANEKLYVNRKEGFVGYGLKKDEYIADCSDMDDVIVFRKDGKYQVVKIADKLFVGKDILYVDVWKKGDERKIYHAVYLDGKTGRSFVKRFAVTAVTRATEYDLTQGTPNSKVLYFTAHPNSEAEEITVTLHPAAKAKNKTLLYDFGELAIKGRTAQGNVLSPHPIKAIKQTGVGASTLGGRKIWVDETVGRLNTDERGRLLGKFDTGERILVLYKNGSYELTDFELTNRYEMNDMVSLTKLLSDTVVSCIYYHGEKKAYFVKRFKIETTTTNQRFYFVDEHKSFQLTYATTSNHTQLQYDYQPARNKTATAQLNLSEFIEVKGWKVLGNKLTDYKITAVRPIPTATATTDHTTDPLIATTDQQQPNNAQLFDEV